VWIWWINNCEHFRLFQLDHTSVGRHQVRYSEPKMGTHLATTLLMVPDAPMKIAAAT
jgi:hypothetical protein